MRSDQAGLASTLVTLLITGRKNIYNGQQRFEAEDRKDLTMTTNSERSRLFSKARETMERGGNIIHHLTQQEGASRFIAIEIAYALQSGSYTEYAKTETAGVSRREGHSI